MWLYLLYLYINKYQWDYVMFWKIEKCAHSFYSKVIKLTNGIRAIFLRDMWGKFWECLWGKRSNTWESEMASSNFLGTGPSMFTGENYHIWAIKMKVYLKALNLWDVVEVGVDPLPLLPNPTMAQIKNHEE